jgi:Signal transduction histidine kinase
MNVESLAVAGKYLIFILSAMIAAVAFWDEMRHKYIVVLLVAVVDLIYYLSAAKFYCVLKDLSEMIDRMVDNIFEERPFLEFKEADDGIFSKICGRLEKLYAAKAIAVKNMKQEVSVTHELISDISHQVKTPVANIKMYTDIMARKLHGSELASDLKVLEKQADRLDFLMQSLIKMSRLEANIISLKIQDCRLLDILASALSIVLPKAGKKRIMIRTQCGAGIIVSADRKWTAEAVFNILDNAVKYTDAEGWVQIRAVPLESCISLEIADNGIGIRQEEAPLLFKRFYRGESVCGEEGLGLGLALARRIIVMEHGYITAEPGIDGGSIFKIMIPKGEKRDVQHTRL